MWAARKKFMYFKRGHIRRVRIGAVFVFVLNSTILSSGLPMPLPNAIYTQ